MPLQKHLQTQNTKTINFSMMNSVPTTEDLKYALTTAQQNRKPVELPFKNPLNQILFVVRVVPGQGEVKPRWTLERHQTSGQQTLWTQETDHLIMIQGKIKLDTSYSRSTDTSESAPIVLGASTVPAPSHHPSMATSGGFVMPPQDNNPPADEALPKPGFMMAGVDPYNFQESSDTPTFTIYQAPPEQAGFAESSPASSSATSAGSSAVSGAPPAASGGAPPARPVAANLSQAEVASSTECSPKEPTAQEKARQLNSVSSQKLQALITTNATKSASRAESSTDDPNAAPSSSVTSAETEAPHPPSPSFLIGDPYGAGTPENVQFTVFQSKDKPVLPAPVIFDDDLIKSIENKLVNSVTGVADYPTFAYLLLKECQRYQKVHIPICVLTFDITNGEVKRGQELPLEVFGPLVKRLNTLCTPTDAIGYLGRGELAILLWNMDLSAGLSFSRSLYMTLSESPILSCASDEPEAVFIGIAAIPDTCTDAGTVLAAAKKAKETARASNCPYLSFS